MREARIPMKRPRSSYRLAVNESPARPQEGLGDLLKALRGAVDADGRQG